MPIREVLNRMDMLIKINECDVSGDLRFYWKLVTSLENKKKAKSWGQAVTEDLWGWLFNPREQNRKYREAFAKHELENKTKVESWRKALVDASNISGWEPKHVANGHESRVIKEIVDTISHRLQLVPSSANKNLVGMAARMQRLKLELQIGSGGVRMIGIWGVGGGGKTTLASSIYDEISSNFDGCCFVKNIREESSKNGLLLSSFASTHARITHPWKNMSTCISGGLPLALAVLGSFLCDKNINEWRSALARLKEIPNDNIVETLKISFDGLTKVERELFLDIACFFRGREKDEAMEILEACGFHPVIGVKVLIQKPLITISEDGHFDMHDLVQEMGHHIVRGERPNNPEKHTRVWKEEDVAKICDIDATSELDKIEAIIMVFRFQPAKKQAQYLPSVAANMKNLWYMESFGDPAKSLFNDIPLRELCCLILFSGSQNQLWEGCKVLPSLKLLRICDMYNLIMTPDFNGLPNLKRFILHECPCLEEIHPSIGYLEKLVFLSIEQCGGLDMFPPIMGLKKLKTLSFKGHLKFVKFPKIQQKKMENLPHLNLDNSGDHEEPCLCRLGFFHNLQELRFLRKLDLCWSNLGDEDIGSDVLEFPNLQELNLYGNKFSQLSFSCLQFPRLKWLDVSYCKELVELSELPQSIAIVIADYCDSLESFGDISKL
ncbi:unnamed protein product [Lactuca virosa]|uniref:NB-ARC domain-containing protein n=1 Tax=Lactuca virosa TaxID=75947 RepID=A0AAU9MY76_9ASTR|nr:unnamed protein product [Lactuca virosa]